MDFAAILLDEKVQKVWAELMAEAVLDLVVDGQDSSYARSVHADVLDGGKDVEVAMSGTALRLDRPREGYNISARLLASPKAKIAKDGSRYMNVPMGDEFRTTSSKKPPWMTKPYPGLRRFDKARKAIPDLIVVTREMAMGGEDQ